MTFAVRGDASSATSVATSSGVVKRPDGMPAFRDKLTTEQIWQLAGYVQAMGAYSAQTAAPNRNDEMQARPSENRAPAAANGPG